MRLVTNAACAMRRTRTIHLLRRPAAQHLLVPPPLVDRLLRVVEAHAGREDQTAPAERLQWSMVRERQSDWTSEWANVGNAPRSLVCSWSTSKYQGRLVEHTLTVLSKSGKPGMVCVRKEVSDAAACHVRWTHLASRYGGSLRCPIWTPA